VRRGKAKEERKRGEERRGEARKGNGKQEVSTKYRITSFEQFQLLTLR